MSTRRLKRLVVAAVCLIFASPAPGTAGSQANDLSANLGFTALVSSPRGSATESLGFEIAAYIVWDATEPVTLELQVAVPEGIRWPAARQARPTAASALRRAPSAPER